MAGQMLYVVDLKSLIEEMGEHWTKPKISSFDCSSINMDVLLFLHEKAFEFSKRGFASTHLVFLSDAERTLVGYFAMAVKSFVILGNLKGLTGRMKKHIPNYSQFHPEANCYVMPVPLIGQLGKNYAVENKKSIQGCELLTLACNKVKETQRVFSGRFVYVECEDKPRLVSFYQKTDSFNSVNEYLI